MIWYKTNLHIDSSKRIILAAIFLLAQSNRVKDKGFKEAKPL